MAGRHPGLTDLLIGQISTTMATGLSATRAAALHGIPHSTIALWINKGREGQTHKNPPKKALIYIRLVEEIERSSAKIEKDLSETVIKAALENPHLALKVLSKRFQDWGDRLQISSEDNPERELVIDDQHRQNASELMGQIRRPKKKK